MKRIILMVVLLVSCCVSQPYKEESETQSYTEESGIEESGTLWTYQDLPALTNEQRIELALKAQKEGDTHYQKIIEEAETLSQNLEEYIYKWLNGEADPEIPDGLLPPYIDSEKTHSWRLQKPDEITPQDQWYSLPMYDPQTELHQNSPDPHATYLKLIFIAPFNSKLKIEGDFPYCRFMDYQILQPFDPYHPVTGNMGVCEVPIVDVDITPDPGHINPFQVDANRYTHNRHYHLQFELKMGNSVDLNPVMDPPEYRAPGNTRTGGPFGVAGPWGDNALVPSVLWLRIYAPDKGKEPYGGVEWPKAVLQLPTGEEYWITCDKSKAVADQTAPVQVESTPPQEMYPFEGSFLGWFKMYGIDLVMMEANAYRTSEPWGSQDISTAKKQVRTVYKLLWNRGATASPPGNFECGATCCNYISYLVRPLSLGRNQVIVITGTLPEFPHTRNNEEIMESGEVRYFSITHSQGGKNSINTGIPLGSLMDDEIGVNDNNEYIIVYSRVSEKPYNATPENGVTWQEWEPSSRQTVVVRWMNVIPDWYLPCCSPDSYNIPWKTGAWSQDAYDATLVGKNSPGIMGIHHPVIHIMSVKEFETLKDDITLENIPEWTSLYILVIPLLVGFMGIYSRFK
jgi:hypothetical protein